jgi:hypothetical protein
VTGQINIRCTATRLAFSDAYNRDLIDAMRCIESDRRNGLPLPRLVWRARAAYYAAWLREIERAQC